MSWQLKRDISGFDIRWSDEACARYRREHFWRDDTLRDIAMQAVQQHPDKTLLIEDDRHYSRAEVWDQALRLVTFFLNKGLEPGDVISFQLPNWHETAVIALAARILGLVINPIPPIYRESETAYILADCRSKLVFIPGNYRKHDYLAMMQQLQPGLPALQDIVVLRDESSTASLWSKILQLAPADVNTLAKPDAAAVMMLMYTSGTTGRPKGVLHTHYSYDYRVRGMAEGWGIGASDVVFMPSPVTHITGAFWVFDMPWVSASCSVLLDTWTPEAGLACIEKHGCTVSGGATPFLQQLLEASKPKPQLLASLRLFFCGGTTVAPEIIRQASKAAPHCLFFRAYGSTEMTTTTMGIRDASMAEYGAQTDGEVVYPTEVRIVNANDASPLAKGEEGEIIARGPEQFVGYLHSDDNTSCFDEEGYFFTGDLGRWANDNFLVITGRKKDIIIRSGENISPKEVEDALATHPAIQEVAIVAMPSAATGEKGCAFIIPRQAQTLSLSDLQQHLATAGMARQKFPEHLELVEELPRVASGKVRKDVLRTMARQLAEEPTP